MLTLCALALLQLSFFYFYFQCLKAMLDAVELDGKVFSVVCNHRHNFCALSIFIKSIWLLIAFKCLFAGSCWHLRRLDWCEEVGEPLMDEVSVWQYWQQYVINQCLQILFFSLFCFIFCTQFF